MKYFIKNDLSGLGGPPLVYAADVYERMVSNEKTKNILLPIALGLVALAGYLVLRQTPKRRKRK